MKVAILVRSDFRSPRVLAESLKSMLEKLDVESEIIWDSHSFLRRILPLKEKPKHWELAFHARVRQKFASFGQDRRLIKKLKKFDVIIFSETSPNGFWKNYYDIESLRKVLPQKPILFHEVFFLENAPLDKARWLDKEDYGTERYDWHLSVSSTTEIASKPVAPWSAIGLDIKHAGISFTKKKVFKALIDFAPTHGNLQHQDQIKDVLKKLNIPYTILRGEFTFKEIRAIYEEHSIFFMQEREMFSIPIAENLAAGNLIFTPSSSWPMAWRQGGNLQPGGEGELPECFKVYKDYKHLESLLLECKEEYDPSKTPESVFRIFLKNYPTFYTGNLSALKDTLEEVL